MRITNYWLIWKNAAKIRRLLLDSSSLNEAWSLIIPILKTSDVVYTGRVGATATLPLQAEILENMTKDRSSENIFKAHLNDKNAVLVAYCIAGLQRLHHSASSDLPDELFCRQEMIEWRGGSFFKMLTLGEYARNCLLKN